MFGRSGEGVMRRQRRPYQENKWYWDVYLFADRKKHGIKMLSWNVDPIEEDEK